MAAMESLLVVLLVVGVLWFFARRQRGTESPAKVVASREESDRAVTHDHGQVLPPRDLPKVSQRASPEHRPPSPSGRGGTAWSPRTKQLEVAGEWYRASNLRALFAKHAHISDTGTELRLDATLVPDPTNPHDSNAVAVFVDGLHVGYMERHDARVYHAPIAAVPGGELIVPSRQWLRGTSTDTWARVTLSLPAPEGLSCPNASPDGCVLLPAGATVQVTGEERYIEHLSRLINRFGSESVVAATLRAVVEKRPRSSVELVVVDIDGSQVGVLTPTQTANLLPLVRRAEAEGRALVCRASMRGNATKVDVALHVRKAHEYDDVELAALFG